MRTRVTLFLLSLISFPLFAQPAPVPDPKILGETPIPIETVSEGFEGAATFSRVVFDKRSECYRVNFRLEKDIAGIESMTEWSSFKAFLVSSNGAILEYIPRVSSSIVHMVVDPTGPRLLEKGTILQGTFSLPGNPPPLDLSLVRFAPKKRDSGAE